MNYYGNLTRQEIEFRTLIVCTHFESPRIGYWRKKVFRARDLILETLATETGLGSIKPTPRSGHGIAQFERPGFERAKRKGLENRELVDQFGYDIEHVKLTDLDNDELLSILFCRLFYKSILDPIPNTRWLRGIYWKKYYNTIKGAGTVEHYMQMCKEVLDG